MDILANMDTLPLHRAVPPIHGPECLAEMNTRTGEVVYRMCWHCAVCGYPTSSQTVHRCTIIPGPCNAP